MAEQFQPLSGGEVVFLKQAADTMPIAHSTFKVSELTAVLKQKFLGDAIDTEAAINKLFSSGVECEILAPYKNWQTGKIRITLEFCPDTPPLPETLPTPSYPQPSGVNPDLSLEEIRRMRAENP
ncbi:KGK domain-containing protein [[Phormidium] sp. ETS-05]|uniref:KGK domain-containing protein n=1 Tax=[Phormidium] sp. ETS-05 TaxID=222819 RepID=UPI0018EED15C|nr:KGK domain-containing protein [[Phormidium] sp. ETS-05]